VSIVSSLRSLVYGDPVAAVETLSKCGQIVMIPKQSGAVYYKAMEDAQNAAKTILKSADRLDLTTLSVVQENLKLMRDYLVITASVKRAAGSTGETPASVKTAHKYFETAIEATQQAITRATKDNFVHIDLKGSLS
jgi:hypothetical protein